MVARIEEEGGGGKAGCCKGRRRKTKAASASGYSSQLMPRSLVAEVREGRREQGTERRKEGRKEGASEGGRLIRPRPFQRTAAAGAGMLSELVESEGGGGGGSRARKLEREREGGRRRPFKALRTYVAATATCEKSCALL
jgi:hypothetical protein